MKIVDIFWWWKVMFKKIKKKVYKLHIPKELSSLKGLTFVMISDFHNNDYGIDLEKTMDIIRGMKPEFIIFAGDIITARPFHNNSVGYEFIRRVASEFRVYYGVGNHEHRLNLYRNVYGNAYDEFMDVVNSTDVCYLDNSRSVYTYNGQDVCISGLSIDARYYDRHNQPIMDEAYIKGILGETNPNNYEILIAHNPAYFDAYAKWRPNLILSGHVHGGIARLPFLGGVISPDLKLFPKYDYGVYKEGSTAMILSSGLGAHSIPIRVFNPPEIVKVILV